MKAWLTGTHKAPVVTTCIQGKSRPLNCKPPPPHTPPSPTFYFCSYAWRWAESNCFIATDTRLRADKRNAFQRLDDMGVASCVSFFYLPARTQFAWEAIWKERSPSIINSSVHFASLSPVSLLLIPNSKAHNIFGKSPWILLATLLLLFFFLEDVRTYKRKRDMQQRSG